MNRYICEALRITELIVTNGGMANKTAVEDVLINMFSTLDRASAHDIMNEIEFFDMKAPNRRLHPDTNPPTVEEYAPYFHGVDVKWYRGNPFARES
jgi:aspartate 1-decarboxylase